MFIYLISAIYTVIVVVLKNIKNLRELILKLSPIISLFILILTEYLTYHLLSFKDLTLFLVIINGLYFGLITTKLILCTMTKVFC
jgi:hypothetical protein